MFTVLLAVGALAKPAPTFLSYQDSIGQYSFGYSAPLSARSEVRYADGLTRGSYSYVDDAGYIQSAEYEADSEHGFRIIATNLPQAPLPIEDTPEVVAAREAHLLAVQDAILREQELSRLENRLEYRNARVNIESKASDPAEILETSDVRRVVAARSHSSSVESRDREFQKGSTQHRTYGITKDLPNTKDLPKKKVDALESTVSGNTGIRNKVAGTVVSKV